MAPAGEQTEKLPLSRSQFILRICGGALLTICAVMVVLGTTVLHERLSGLHFVFYWTWCLLLTLGAIIVALWDMILVRRTLKRTRRALFEREFMNRDPAGKSPGEKWR